MANGDPIKLQDIYDRQSDMELRLVKSLNSVKDEIKEELAKVRVDLAKNAARSAENKQDIEALQADAKKADRTNLFLGALISIGTGGLAIWISSMLQALAQK